MKIWVHIVRVMRIHFVLIRYNIDELIFGTQRFYILRFLLYCNPYYWRAARKQMTRGERVRRALETLGPIFVKAGQLLSTRRDLLPEDIASELSLLQDRVPPFPGKQAKKIIEQCLSNTIDHLFATFDINALASASIAQVHSATLHSGESVVVKVLRPNVNKMIDRDMALLLFFAKMVEKYWKSIRSLKPVQIVHEIKNNLSDELNLMREGANASELRRRFAHSKLLYIPKIYWAYSHTQVLVMERVYGISIDDIDRLKQAGVNLHRLAERGIEIFLTQVFRDNFFHADMHPGNIFISTTHPAEPQYIFVDFGIVGTLSREDQRYIAENMIAFFQRDYQRVAELHINCGWLPKDTRIDQFASAIRTVAEPMFELPLGEISVGKLLLGLFQTARQFHINIQPQLILLQKTILHLESLSRQLAPDLAIWLYAQPHIEKWLKKHVGWSAFLRRLREQLPLWSLQLPELPALLYALLKK